MSLLFDNSPDQRPRWDFTAPMSHTNDPASSREAAQKHAASGRHLSNIELVHRLVQRHPRKTACELWALATEAERGQLKEYQELRKRLSDLSGKPEPLVRRGKMRDCTVKPGSRQCEWEAV
jgi:hypothetical protein